MDDICRQSLCIICGEELIEKQDWYCSMPCAGADWAVSGEQWPYELQQLRMKSNLHLRNRWWDSEIVHQWDSQEIDTKPKYTGFDKDLKSGIRKRDNYTCAICGRFGRCIHHIDYNKQNAARKNLICLCVPCHSKTNGNRKYWESILSPIAIRRENTQFQF